MAGRFRFGKREGVKTIAAVCGLALGLSVLGEAHAQSIQRPMQRSASPSLHISVVVLPIIETLPPAREKQSFASITFNLEPPPPLLDENYEIRSFAPEARSGRTQPAGVLETLVVVPR
jgi:hypothetical protein